MSPPKKNNKVLMGLAGIIYVLFLTQYGVGFIRVGNVDLPSFYWAARAAFAEGQSPYDYDDVLSRKPPDAGQRIYPFVYPPPSLLVFYPLSLTSYDMAKTLMLGLNHLSLLAVVYVLFFRILDLGRHQVFATLGLIYIYVYDPIVATIYHGQINLIALVFVCLAWLFLKKSYRAPAVAFPLSLAILVKTYPVLFLLYLAVKRKLKIILWTVGFLGIYTAAAYAILPSPVWSDWLAQALASGGYGKAPRNLFSPAHPWNQSLNGLIARVFLENEFSQALLPNPTLARTLPYFFSLVVIGIVIKLCWPPKPGSRWSSQVDREFAVLLLAMVMVAPLSWQHHLVFALPGVVLAGHRVVHSEKEVFPRIVVGVSAFLLAWRLPLESSLLKEGAATLLISAKFYAVAALWLFLTFKLGARRKEFQPRV